MGCLCTKPAQVVTLEDAEEPLPSPRHFSSRGPCYAWLQELGLPQYAAAFEESGFGDWDLLACLTEGDIDAIAAHTGASIPPGHRKKLLMASRRMGQASLQGYTSLAPAPGSARRYSHSSNPGGNNSRGSGLGAAAASVLERRSVGRRPSGSVSRGSASRPASHGHITGGGAGGGRHTEDGVASGRRSRSKMGFFLSSVSRASSRASLNGGGGGGGGGLTPITAVSVSHAIGYIASPSVTAGALSGPLTAAMGCGDDPKSGGGPEWLTSTGVGSDGRPSPAEMAGQLAAAARAVAGTAGAMAVTPVVAPRPRRRWSVHKQPSKGALVLGPPTNSSTGWVEAEAGAWGGGGAGAAALAQPAVDEDLRQLSVSSISAYGNGNGKFNGHGGEGHASGRSHAAAGQAVLGSPAAVGGTHPNPPYGSPGDGKNLEALVVGADDGPYSGRGAARNQSLAARRERLRSGGTNGGGGALAEAPKSRVVHRISFSRNHTPAAVAAVGSRPLSPHSQARAARPSSNHKDSNNINSSSNAHAAPPPPREPRARSAMSAPPQIPASAVGKRRGSGSEGGSLTGLVAAADTAPVSAAAGAPDLLGAWSRRSPSPTFSALQQHPQYRNVGSWASPAAPPTAGLQGSQGGNSRRALAASPVAPQAQGQGQAPRTALGPGAQPPAPQAVINLDGGPASGTAEWQAPAPAGAAAPGAASTADPGPPRPVTSGPEGVGGAGNAGGAASGALPRFVRAIAGWANPGSSSSSPVGLTAGAGGGGRQRLRSGDRLAAAGAVEKWSTGRGSTPGGVSAADRFGSPAPPQAHARTDTGTDGGAQEVAARDDGESRAGRASPARAATGAAPPAVAAGGVAASRRRWAQADGALVPSPAADPTDPWDQDFALCIAGRGYRPAVPSPPLLMTTIDSPAAPAPSHNAHAHAAPGAPDAGDGRGGQEPTVALPEVAAAAAAARAGAGAGGGLLHGGSADGWPFVLPQLPHAASNAHPARGGGGGLAREEPPPADSVLPPPRVRHVGHDVPAAVAAAQWPAFPLNPATRAKQPALAAGADAGPATGPAAPAAADAGERLRLTEPSAALLAGPNAPLHRDAADQARSTTQFAATPPQLEAADRARPAALEDAGDEGPVPNGGAGASRLGGGPPRPTPGRQLDLQMLAEQVHRIMAHLGDITADGDAPGRESGGGGGGGGSGGGGGGDGGGAEGRALASVAWKPGQRAAAAAGPAAAEAVPGAATQEPQAMEVEEEEEGAGRRSPVAGLASLGGPTVPGPERNATCGAGRAAHMRAMSVKRAELQALHAQLVARVEAAAAAEPHVAELQEQGRPARGAPGGAPSAGSPWQPAAGPVRPQGSGGGGGADPEAALAEVEAAIRAKLAELADMTASAAGIAGARRAAQAADSAAAAAGAGAGLGAAPVVKGPAPAHGGGSGSGGGEDGTGGMGADAVGGGIANPARRKRALVVEALLAGVGTGAPAGALARPQDAAGGPEARPPRGAEGVSQAASGAAGDAGLPAGAEAALHAEVMAVLGARKRQAAAGRGGGGEAGGGNVHVHAAAGGDARGQGREVRGAGGVVAPQQGLVGPAGAGMGGMAVVAPEGAVWDELKAIEDRIRARVEAVAGRGA